MAEVIAIHIRNDADIEGIIVGNTEIKIKMLADDTTLLLQDLSSVNLAIKDFDIFSKCSGLKLNLQKTEVIPPIGSNLYRDKLLKTLSGITLKRDPFKRLEFGFLTMRQR